MNNQKPTNGKDERNEITNTKSNSKTAPQTSPEGKQNSNIQDKKKTDSDINIKSPTIPKKPVKPPKLEDKPFDEFINQHLIPGLKSSIEERGAIISDIKLIEGERPVVGGNCWMIFCEMTEQRKFWLCFNKKIITSDKTILLAESNSDPSIVESFLIDEKKTTLALLISRVIQRLNGQKWIGAN